jgi:bifunctional DNA-binding transcriptional regulator/antitoxin component of YhaV-PrlF toxin-antitoxin module
MVPDLTRYVKVREVGGTTVITIPADMRRALQLRKGMRLRLKLRYVPQSGGAVPTDFVVMRDPGSK